MKKFRIVKNEVEDEDIYYTIERKFLLWWMRCPIDFGTRTRDEWYNVWYNDVPLDRMIVESHCIKFNTEQDAKVQVDRLMNLFYEEFGGTIITTVLDEDTWEEFFIDLGSEEYLFKNQSDKGYKYSKTLQGIKSLIGDNEPKSTKKTIID